MSRIPQSRIIAFLALSVAAMAHAGAMVFSSTPDIDLAGGETALAAEGSSFVNLAEGIDRPPPRTRPSCSPCRHQRSPGQQSPRQRPCPSQHPS